MRIRLMVFLSVIVILMVLGLFIVLQVSGLFLAGKAAAENDIERDFFRIYNSLSGQFGDATVQLVSLAQALSRSIEAQLADREIHVSDLKNNPGVLEEIIGNELHRLKLALERTKCSGVFMVLDATVNPELPNAENSRAGIHLRVLEPNVPGAPEMTYLYYRGFPSIAYDNGLLMQVKWEMEFDLRDFDYYRLHMEKRDDSRPALSNLYHWSKENIIAETYEAALLCIIPLLDSDGSPFGICGFEISDVNFLFAYAPDDSDFRNIFSMFGEFDETGIKTEGALLAGKSMVISDIRETGTLAFSPGSILNSYEDSSGQNYYGLHREIRLYPTDSVFAGRNFALSLLVSKSEIDGITYRAGVRLIIGCLMLMALGIGISVFVSKRYLSPIERMFEAVRSGKLDSLKTNITEIDGMLEQVRNLRAKGSPFPDDFFIDFTKRAKTLSAVERRIFNFYLTGADDKEIMAALFITKDALKKHCRRIYEKLGVSGKEPMMLYIELINMSGQADKIIRGG